MFTGCDYPFCGAQKALDALIHGDISGIWHYNPFPVILSLYLTLVIPAVLKIIPPGSRVQKVLYNRWMIPAAGLATIAW